MVCYARWAYSFAGVVLVGFLLLGQPAAHFLAVEALMVSLSIVMGGATLAAAAAFVTFRTVQRRRALAGGCVGCQYQCQHAMTCSGGSLHAPPPTRLWLISTIDRGAQVPARVPAPARAAAAERPQVVMLPTPHWPDRPLRSETLRAEAPAQQVRVPARAS